MIAHIRRNLLSSGSFLIGAVLISHVLNLIYSSYIGRSLTLANFGLITLINTCITVVNIIFSAISATVNYHVGYLTARFGKDSSAAFHNRLQKKLIIPVISISFIWVLFSSQISNYFHVNSTSLILAFLPILLVGFFASVSGGFIKGRFLFQLIGLFYVAEAIIKLIITHILITQKMIDLVYLSVPASVVFSCVITIVVGLFLAKRGVSKHPHIHHFSKAFFIAAILTGLSSTAFLTLDILLVKHYFSAKEAGIYSLLSLVGKMIFFFGSMFNTFIISLVSRDEGAKRDPIARFYFVLSATSLLTILAAIGLVLGGPYILPIVFGKNILSIEPYLLMYSIAIALYTISTTISAFHLARKHYFFSAIALFSTLSLALSISLHHNSLNSVVFTIFIVSLVNTAVVGLVHLIQRNGGFLLQNVLDLYGSFIPIPKLNYTPLGKRILVFNWRDTKHAFAGGAETYIHELGKRLVKDGNSVTLFCGNDHKLPRHDVIDGVRIIRRGGFYSVYFWAFLYYVFRHRGKFDIIIDCENGIPFFTPFYAKEKKFLLIHHVHQEVFRKSLVWPFSAIASFLEIKLMPYAYKNTQIITVSPSTKLEIIAHKLSRIEPIIIYNGIDHEIYKPGKKSKTPVVLYIGRLKFYKTINVFIRMAKKLSLSNPNTTFLIAGEGEELKKLKAYAKKINSPVHFLGKVSEKEKIKLLQSAWVVVNPSSMEGWGLTVIEANACGTPVVASEVPGLKDSVSHEYSGYLAKHGDVKEFSKRVQKILNDRHLRNALSQKAHTWSKNFSWDLSKKKVQSLIIEHSDQTQNLQFKHSLIKN